MCWCGARVHVHVAAWMLAVRVFVETQSTQQGAAAQTQSNIFVRNRLESHLEMRKKIEQPRYICALCFALLNNMILWFTFLGRTINTRQNCFGLKISNLGFGVLRERERQSKHWKSVFAYLCSTEIYHHVKMHCIYLGVSLYNTQTLQWGSISGWNSLSLWRSEQNGVV